MRTPVPAAASTPSWGVVDGPAIVWLSELAPASRNRPLIHASSGGHFTRAVRAVGRDAAQWAVEVGQDVAERVAAEIPAHAADGGFEVLRMGTESTVLQLLIVFSGAEVETAMTPESMSGLPDFVRGRVGLDELLRGIQLGHSVIAAAFLDECARRGTSEVRHEQMRLLSQRMFGFFDTFSTQMAAAYREEQLRWAQSEATKRLAIVEEILRGNEPAEKAAQRLRYDLSRTHIGVIVWSSARTLDSDQQALHDAAGQWLRDAGCGQKLVLDVSTGVVWAWMIPQADWAETARLLSDATLPPHMHAVFGGAGRGLAGFRASHADAAAGFRLRAVMPSPQVVTSYHDIDLLSLLLADRERAVRFARAELGELGRDDPQYSEMRRTLAIYLEEGGSPQSAGSRLQISRNTVTYRVRKAEEILGRPLDARRRHVQAALAILDETRIAGN